MGLIVKHADGSEFVTIPDKTYDEKSTTLKLPGKGVLNWGESYVNNFVHLLENFASSTEPRNPQAGQLWYNTETSILAVFTITQEWEAVNKDSDIEEKFGTLIAHLQENHAGTEAPEQPVKGMSWYDTNINSIKIFDGEKWTGHAINTYSSFLEPKDANTADIWYDKNINNLKFKDEESFQRILSTVESSVEPTDVEVGQFWTNINTGKMFVYKKNKVSNEFYWQEMGADEVTEGDTPPDTADTGAMHITRTQTNNILYINKGSKNDVVWVEIPEFGGAIKSINEPTRVIDGMFWLDGNDVLKIRKSDKWVDINESAVSIVSDEEPEIANDGVVWFDTRLGQLKIKVDGIWSSTQVPGLIAYGEAPLAPKEGQLWFKKETGELKIFNGEDWANSNSRSTLVGYQTPTDASEGQLWLDTNASELKIKKGGRWASLPENARAFLTIPENPINGDMVYMNNALRVYDGAEWKDINVSISNTTLGDDVAINFDDITNEIVITNNGIVTRVPLAVKRDIIIENVGITSDVIEVLHPTIEDGERRIIDVKKVNLKRDFFVFKNGQWTDNYKVDGDDLVLFNSRGEDEVDVLQFNGDITINYNVKKFTSPVSGTFTIDNYTRTSKEQAAYDIIKKEFDDKKIELISAHGANSSEEDLDSSDWEILDEISGRFEVKESNQIADLSLGAVMVFKEGVSIPTDSLTINKNNENKISIPNVNKGQEFTIIQLIAGTDYKASFYSREYAFKIGEVEDTTESQLNTKGRVMSDLLKAASKNTANYGEVDVNYTFDQNTKLVTFDLIDVDTNYHFFVTRNNLFVTPSKYNVDKENNTITLHANNLDDIRFFQFYLPHKYVPVEFNYVEKLAEQDGWITLELNRNFDLNEPIVVFRNGAIQESANINIITSETTTDNNGNKYTVDGIRKVQVFGDVIPNTNTNLGINKDDLITVMQIAQPENFHIFLEEFGAKKDGTNIFDVKDLSPEHTVIVYRNGLKIDIDEYTFNENGDLVVGNCNGPTDDELAENADAIGDIILAHQFFTKDAIENDMTITAEIVTATTNGVENFQLQKTEFVADEFLLVFKNGQLITRRQSESETTTQTQINTYKVFSERIYHNQVAAYDSNGDPIYDAEGNPVLNVDPDDYSDVMAFRIDNVTVGEEIEIYEINKKVTEVNNIASSNHYEILPDNNIQRLYTTKFDQLSNMTMVFQDGLIIDREINNLKEDFHRINGMYRVLDQYSIDNKNKSIIVDDWKIGGKLRVQQFTAAEVDIKTVTLTVKVLVDDTYDVFLPNNETYIPNTGGIEVYIDRQIQWTDDDFQEVANNRIMFNKGLKKDQIIKMIVRR